MKFILSHCNCRPGESIGGKRTKTEFYPNKEAAADAVYRHVTQEDMYWCVHLDGNHILSAGLNGTWYGGFNKDGTRSG